MAGKKDGKSLSSRIAGMIAAAIATFAARKLIALVWTRTTGKEPPVHPEDPQVALSEALGWAVVAGVVVEASRLLATRATARKFSPGEHPGSSE